MSHILPLSANNLKETGTNQIDILKALLASNKWAFVAYTGQRTKATTSRWYRVKASNWSLLRHQLESFGPELVEQEALGHVSNGYNGRPSSTYLVAHVQAICYNPKSPSADIVQLWTQDNLSFVPFGRELKGHEYLAANTFVFVVRHGLPVGARPYVPLEERSKWALLNREVEANPDNTRAAHELNVMRLEHADRWHAADRAVGHVVIDRPHCVQTEHRWSMPPADYICNRCKQVAHHYAEACEIWPDNAVAEPTETVAWGPKKFVAAKTTTTNDAAYYALMHKKSRAA